ncbi:Zinc finger RING-type [Trinorchestia longiramus]|nr:Zinc finger RING-type [Trinorchestia longiramus]
MTKFPICGACKRPFDGDSRKPRLLPCGHACCTACLSAMEDRDSTNCPEKRCGKDWSDRNLTDLPVVFDLIPESSGRMGGERQVTPAAAGSSRDVTPATRVVSPQPTGREVAPLEPDNCAPSSASSVSGRDESSFPTCVVCMDDFNNNNRPLLLPCGHVSCRMCLEDLEKNDDFTCPQCRQVRSRGQIPRLPVVLSLINPNNANKKTVPRATAADVLNRARDLQREWGRRSASTPDRSDPKNMEIFVKDVRGQIHTFRVNPSAETVIALRQRLPGRPDSCRYLTFEGRTMENNRTLVEYNVRWHCTIEERGRLQGGSQAKFRLQG